MHILKQIAVGVAGSLATLILIAIWGWISGGGLIHVMGGLTADDFRQIEREIRESAAAAALERRQIELPTGAILPWHGTEAIPEDWVLCGQTDTPNLTDRFLVRTDDFKEIGEEIGTPDHVHDIDFGSQHDFGEAGDYNESADNGVGQNWPHRHKIIGSTEARQHIPPSVQVMFLCKPE